MPGYDEYDIDSFSNFSYEGGWLLAPEPQESWLQRMAHDDVDAEVADEEAAAKLRAIDLLVDWSVRLMPRGYYADELADAADHHADWYAEWYADWYADWWPEGGRRGHWVHEHYGDDIRWVWLEEAAVEEESFDDSEDDPLLVNWGRYMPFRWYQEELAEELAEEE